MDPIYLYNKNLKYWTENIDFPTKSSGCTHELNMI